jgi:sec-independent protein translocase protein TatB
MFDMGITEMMLIGVVALVVIGPERLPGVARTAGKYIGRLKRFMTSVKADVEQELRADELRQILSDQQKELDSLKDTISEAGREIEKEANVMDDVVETPSADAVESSSVESPSIESPSIESPGNAPLQADAADAASAETAAAATKEPPEEPTSKTGS